MDKINTLEKEIEDLRKLLHSKENELYKLKQDYTANQNINIQSINLDQREENGEELLRAKCGALPKWAIERYSRQILMREIGVHGQSKLCSAKVLIVGAGGLGCPAALYLAGAGVGEIGIVDYDIVEITNIHRQVLHTERDVNMNKAESAAQALRNINSRIKVTPYVTQIDSTNAFEIATNYDLVLDCTDNAPTRYLLNDLCALVKLPLISGSALKMEGQLTIYGYRSEKHGHDKSTNYRGPCYRCVFPSPPPPEAMGSCSSQGVAGPVPGAIGTLQAMEAIKYIVGLPSTNLLVQRMLILDADDMSCRVVQLRPRSTMCAACSDNPTITHLVDYEAFCNAIAKEKELDVNILPPENRITPKELSEILKTKNKYILIDVRADSEYTMCHISGAYSWPIETLHGVQLDKLLENVEQCPGQVIFICRRGNDSQMAAKMILDMLSEEQKYKVKDMMGGLHAWAEQVDRTFPVY